MAVLESGDHDEASQLREGGNSPAATAEAVELPGFVRIPGLTDDFADESLEICWGRVMERLKAGGEYTSLLDYGYIPYIIPLYESVTPAEAALKLPLFAQRFFDPGNPDILTISRRLVQQRPEKYAAMVPLWASRILANNALQSVLADRKMQADRQKAYKHVEMLARMVVMPFDVRPFVEALQDNDFLERFYVKVLAGGNMLPMVMGDRISMIGQFYFRNAPDKMGWTAPSPADHPLFTVVEAVKKRGDPGFNLKAFLGNLRESNCSIFGNEKGMAIFRDSLQVLHRAGYSIEELEMMSGEDQATDFERPFGWDVRILEQLPKKDSPLVAQLAASSGTLSEAEIAKMLKSDKPLMVYEKVVSSRYDRLPAFCRIGCIMAIYKALKRGPARTHFLHQVLPAVFDSDPSVFFLDTLAPSYYGEAGFREDFISFIRKNNRYFDSLMQAFKRIRLSQHNCMTAMMLADFCGGNGNGWEHGDNESAHEQNRATGVVLNGIFSEPEDLEDTLLAVNFILFYLSAELIRMERIPPSDSDMGAFYEAARKRLRSMAVAIINRPGFREKLGQMFEAGGGDLEMIRRKIHFLTRFEDEDLLAVLEELKFVKMPLPEELMTLPNQNMDSRSGVAAFAAPGSGAEGEGEVAVVSLYEAADGSESSDVMAEPSRLLDFSRYFDFTASGEAATSASALYAGMDRMTAQDRKAVLLLAVDRGESVRVLDPMPAKREMLLISLLKDVVTQGVNPADWQEEPEKFTRLKEGLTPEEVRALMSDIVEIWHRHWKKSGSKEPAEGDRPEGKFEDPLRLGKQKLEWLATDRVYPENDNAKYTSIFNQASLIMRLAELQAGQFEQASRKQQELLVSSFETIVEKRLKLPYTQLLPAFLRIYGYLSGMRKSQFLNSFMTVYMNANEDETRFGALLSAYENPEDDQFRRELLLFFRKKDAMLKKVVALLKEDGPPASVVFAAKILADLAERKTGNGSGLLSAVPGPNKELYATAKNIFATTEDLFNPVLAENIKLMVLFAQLNEWGDRLDDGKDDGVVAGVKLQARGMHADLLATVLGRKQFIEKVFKDEDLIPIDGLAARLKSMPFFAVLDDGLISSVLFICIRVKRNQDMVRRLQEADLPPGFDRQKLMDGINAAGLVEGKLPIEIVMDGMVPEGYKVFLGFDEKEGKSQTAKSGAAENLKVMVFERTDRNNDILLEYLAFGKDEIARPQPPMEKLAFGLEGEDDIVRISSVEEKESPPLPEKLKDIWAYAVGKFLGLELEGKLSVDVEQIAGTPGDVMPAAEPPVAEKPASDPPDSGQSLTAPEEEDDSPSSAPAEQKGGEERDGKPAPVELKVDLREKDPKTRKKSVEVRAAIDLDQKQIISLLNGTLRESEFDSLRLFRKVKGIKSKDAVYERIGTEEVRELFRKGELIGPDVYVMCRSPHLKALGYFVHTENRVDEHGDAIIYDTLQEKERQLNAELAYAYYKDSGMPDLDEFSVHPGLIRIPVDVYEKRGNCDAYTMEDGEMLSCAGNVVIKDENERLLSGLLRDDWIGKWFDSQAEILVDEMKEVEHGSLPEEDKKREIAARQEKIEGLPELKRKTYRNLRWLEPESGVREGVKGAVQFALGWVDSTTTFNKGHFESLEAFLAAAKSKIGFAGEILGSGKPAEGKDAKRHQERGIIEILSYEQLCSIVNIIGLLTRHNGPLEPGVEGRLTVDEDLRAAIIGKMEKNPKATAEHQSTLLKFYKLIGTLSQRNFVGVRSFDLVSVCGDKGFLWEIKSINTGDNNELDQIRLGNGQLDEYEVYDVQTTSALVNLVKKLYKGIILSKRPEALDDPREQEVFGRYIESLEKSGKYIFWFEDGRLQGSETAMGKLAEFAAGA